MYFPDLVSEEELKTHGFDYCLAYCKDYCWPYGFGYCDNCALDKEIRNPGKMEGDKWWQKELSI